MAYRDSFRTYKCNKKNENKLWWQMYWPNLSNKPDKKKKK